jgi:hypothetical protein
LSRILVIFTAALSLLGCTKQQMLDKFAPPADQVVAKHYIDLLRHHQFDEIERATDPSVASPSLRATLDQMASHFPDGEPTSVTLVGAYQMSSGDISTINLTYEYNFSGVWLLANVQVKKTSDKSSITGFNVYPQPKSLEEQNRFSLSRKSVAQYIVLSLAVVLPLFTLYVLVLCIRTRFKGRKWPWVLLVLVGVGKLAVNWTTGQLGFQPIAVQLFSASAAAPFYGPWTLAISLPVGAVLFLLRRQALTAVEAQP